MSKLRSEQRRRHWRRFKAKGEDYCQKCGKRKNLTLDHIVPSSLGGRNAFTNMQVLCRECNHEKDNEIVDYRQHIPWWFNYRAIGR